MPNLDARRFTNPDTLQHIRRGSLLKWLAPAGAYLAGRGVAIPSAMSTDPVDYDKLAGVFVEPDEAMPEYLVNSLFIIHEMADEAGMDAILEAIEAQNEGKAEADKVVLNIDDDPDPADVAVQAWLQDKQLLEEIHNQHQLTRPRSFINFVAEVDEVPDFTPPTEGQIRALEARLAGWFGKKKRGNACRILWYPKDKECWFLVRHGLPCKREGVFKDGKPESVFYRPQKHDVVVYDIENAELRMNCCGVREMQEFQRAFGLYLFSNENFFPGEGKYTLTPLVEKGRNCLACGEVDGIESVTLKEVEFFYGGKPWQRIARRSDDIFSLVENELFKWPDPQRITRAGFEVKFKDSKKTRRVTIIGSNKAQYGRDGDAVTVEKWMKLAGFILTKATNEDDTEPVG
jgi:hypothetical protein